MNAAAALLAAADWDHSGHWWIPFGIFWLVALAAIGLLVVRTTRGRERTGSDRARDILAERYARGELTHDEYRERLEHLKP